LESTRLDLAGSPPATRAAEDWQRHQWHQHFQCWALQEPRSDNRRDGDHPYRLDLPVRPGNRRPGGRLRGERVGGACRAPRPAGWHFGQVEKPRGAGW